MSANRTAELQAMVDKATSNAVCAGEPHWVADAIFAAYRMGLQDRSRNLECMLPGGTLCETVTGGGKRMVPRS